MYQEFLVTHFEPIKDHIVSTVRETLMARHRQGKMTPITQYEDYRFDLIMLWNTVANAKPNEVKPADINHLANLISTIFHKEALSVIHRELSGYDGEDIDFDSVQRTVKNKISDLIHAGVMTNPYNSISDHSFVFNGKYRVVIDDWKLFHTQWNDETGEYESIPSQELKPVIHMEVDLPSGELIIADWIRIPEFTEIMQNPEVENIGYAFDRIKRTVDGVHDHNVIEVAVGNTMPSIVLTTNDTDEISHLRIGCVEYEDDSDTPINPDLNIAGTVTTDYNGATMIDKEHLYDLLRSEMPKDKALQQIDHLINGSPTNRPTVIKVSPGNWHFYFVEYGIGPIHQLEHVTSALGRGLETILMLSKEPLDIDEKFITHAHI